MLTNQAFLSNNIITAIEKNIEKELNTQKTVCKKLKLPADQFPKINLSKSQNVSDIDMKFTFIPNDYSEKGSKKDIKKKFKV